MDNVYYTALYEVAKRLDFLLDFGIEKSQQKNLVIWQRLYKHWIDRPTAYILNLNCIR